uniref:EF-hand domain-containing protein n=1 Tax=Globodera rostochiensis TaxID=31243 RepID=A0A914HGM7_GLORO
MAPTFSSHLVVQIDNLSQMLHNHQRAPIVVSELDSEIESGEERDDMEELNDFTSLLMPAARKSAARRLGALNSPIAKKHQEGKQKKQNTQRNSVPASKFPVIDEDLLMLATRRLPIDGFSAIPPPNLCRLITNVSEARWTTKKPMEHAKSLLEHRPQKERPKSVGHLPIPRGANCEFSQAPAQNMMRKNHSERIRINAPGNPIAHGTLPRLNEEAALRRMSAASGFTTTVEESANCDCTSLAFAAFRSNWMMAMRRKKWQAKQRTEEGDDAYSKASLPLTRTPDSATNDSGISTSSSVSSRSTLLADTAQCRLHLPRLQTSKLSCSRCGVQISLPPKGSPVGGNRMTDSIFRRRRRRWLSYFLGNMMRILEKEKPNDVQKERHCCHGAGVDLKLLTVPATAQSRNIAFTVPLINVQMAQENDGKAAIYESNKSLQFDERRKDFLLGFPSSSSLSAPSAMSMTNISLALCQHEKDGQDSAVQKFALRLSSSSNAACSSVPSTSSARANGGANGDVFELEARKGRPVNSYGRTALTKAVRHSLASANQAAPAISASPPREYSPQQKEYCVRRPIFPKSIFLRKAQQLRKEWSWATNGGRETTLSGTKSEEKRPDERREASENSRRDELMEEEVNGREEEEEEDEEEEEESEEEEDEDEKEESDGTSCWSGVSSSSNPSRSLSMSRSVTKSPSVALCLSMPSGELPPMQPLNYHQWRRSPDNVSPVDRLRVDEVNFTFRIWAKPETSAENNSGPNASGDKSPRWCADPNDAIKKGNRLQWERSKKSGSASSIMVQHQQLINGLITPMVVNSTKVPQAQFITASLLGKDAAEETELPTRNEPEGIEEMDIRVAGKLAASPRFHFSAGRPVSREENERVLLRIRELFESRPRAQLLLDDFDELCRRMDFAVYSKRAVFDACCCSNGLPVLPILASTLGDVAEGAEKAESDARGVPIDFNQFCVYWNRMISEAHDEASRFVFTLSAVRHSHQSLTPPQQRHILSEDFVPMMMDLILTHPGLHFLKEAPQFYSRYADVVIVRIFWNVNRSWTGKISANELRRSNFLQTFRMLDEVQDINKVTDFFSYEHFYVTYCKFWELDTDHDMIISRDDMRRHCNGALTDRIIDRIFSAAVIRTPPEQRTVPQPMGPIRQQPIEAIGFEDFVCFLLAEEDKRHPTSIEYWFRCIDLDGDGQISLYEMEYFYEAIEQKLLAKGMETLALRDVICNLLDSIFPENGHFVTRMDLKRSGLSHRFFNTFVNWIKYVDQESSDGDRASVKTNEDKELSDWEMFCLSEYELLMSETEQTSNEGDVDDENVRNE